MLLDTLLENTEVCVIDDDAEICQILKVFLEESGLSCRTFNEAEPALDYLKQASSYIGVIFCDLKLPDLNGLVFLERAGQMRLDIPIILITAHSSKDTAVAAIQKGAFDYITKPLNFPELKVVVKRALRFHQLQSDFNVLQRQIHDRHSFANLVGKSTKMQNLFFFIKRVADSPSNVLIYGESGTGKELVAKAIHSHGDRRYKPFIAVNCSSIPSELLESELFGHTKGSFTGAYNNKIGLFEAANGGSLFLDEIGDMPLHLQAKLLRVLQERKVRKVGSHQDVAIDVRIIAATHKDLRAAIHENTFREDLYYRLCVIPLKIPPLRERKEDIVLLSEHFLAKYRLNNPKVKGFTQEALNKLVHFEWKGNVRELENTIERAVTLCTGHHISSSDISVEGALEAESQLGKLFSKLPTLKQLELEYIQYVMSKTNGRKEDSAKVLGIDRKTLYRKQKEMQHPPSSADS